MYMWPPILGWVWGIKPATRFLCVQKLWASFGGQLEQKRKTKPLGSAQASYKRSHDHIRPRCLVWSTTLALPNIAHFLALYPVYPKVDWEHCTAVWRGAPAKMCDSLAHPVQQLKRAWGDTLPQNPGSPPRWVQARLPSNQDKTLQVLWRVLHHQ